MNAIKYLKLEQRAACKTEPKYSAHWYGNDCDKFQGSNNLNVNKICQMYMKYIEEWLVSPDDDEREFFIMEKTHPTFEVVTRTGKHKTNPDNETEYSIKDGIHIVVPRITSCPFIQHNVRESIFKNAGEVLDECKFTNGYADIFDRSVIDTNNWQTVQRIFSQ